MTVKELINKLSKLPAKKQVINVNFHKDKLMVELGKEVIKTSEKLTNWGSLKANDCISIYDKDYLLYKDVLFLEESYDFGGPQNLKSIIILEGSISKAITIKDTFCYTLDLP